MTTAARSTLLVFTLALVAGPSVGSARAADARPAGEGQLAPPPADLPVNPQPVVQARPTDASWTRHITVGGGAVLWYYQPFLTGAKDNVDLFFANIVLDAELGRFGFHAEPRVRNGKLRPFFDGPAWVQEVYGHGRIAGEDGSLVLKIGKEYSHFGLFWDNSFYGNVQVYDGLKLDPDYGLSLEGVYREKGRVGLRGWAQFFVIDGQTNVSMAGRDTISIPGARRRNQAIGRLEPFVALGDSALAKLGISVCRLQADLPGLGPQNVFRGAADLTVTTGGLTLWGEYQRQNGQTVTEFPIAGTPAADAGGTATPGQASRHINYALGGGEYTHGLLTARYVFSWGDYRDVRVRETMHVPSLGLSLDPGLSLLAEMVIWQRHTAEGNPTFVDRSLNVTLYGHF
jgi:hypothetical protein